MRMETDVLATNRIFYWIDSPFLDMSFATKMDLKRDSYSRNSILLRLICQEELLDVRLLSFSSPSPLPSPASPLF